MARVYAFCMAALLILMPLNSFSQEQENPLQLYGVNRWKLLLVEPPPYNVFDTNLTGMQILPMEGSIADSAQLFQQYGPSRRIGNEWNMAVHWNCNALTQPYFGVPKYWLIEMRVRSYVNLAYLGLGIGMVDTTLEDYWMYAGEIELTPDWQTFRTPNITTSAKHIHQIGIDFYLYTPDSTYCGLEILLNNLWFVYENGDTVQVDPFQYINPNGIIEQLPGIPTGFELYQNYPNPFNPVTQIRYELSEPSDIKLSVFSLLGEKIADVVDQYQTSGIYEAEFDASGLASGTYIYVLQAGRQTMKKKMALVK